MLSEDVRSITSPNTVSPVSIAEHRDCEAQRSWPSDPKALGSAWSAPLFAQAALFLSAESSAEDAMPSARP